MRALGSVASVVVVTAALIPTARAEADALTDTLGPRELAVGGALRAGATGSTGVALNPAGLPLNREVVFEGGYGHRASDAASVVGITACDSTAANPGCFFYNYVGASPDLAGMTGERRTHTAGMALARQLSPQVSIGATTKYFDFNSDVMGEEDASGFTFDLGATARVTDLMSLGVAGYNLWGERSSQFPRALGGGALARPTSSLTLSFDALWDLETDGVGGRYGGGAEYFFRGSRGQVGYPLRLGAMHNATGAGSTYVTGGLGLSTMKLGVDVAAQRQVGGGDELILTASLRFYGPRAEAGAL